VPFPRDVQFQPDQGLRLLDSVELLRTIQFFIQRLQQGDSARTLSIGLDCLDTMCLEMLQRMQRSWGQVPRRQYSRIQRGGPAFVCAGIPALHFFSSGQKPFSPPVMENLHDMSDDRFFLPTHIEEDIPREVNQDEDFIALDEPAEKILPSPAAEAVDITIASSGIFRVDRWQIKDAAPKGMQLVRHGNARTYVRVGDVIGIQQMEEVGRWSAGVVRWMKSPHADDLEMGVELLAFGAAPVAVASVHPVGAREYQPALLLPAVEVLHRPATLLLPRGAFTPGSNLLLAEEGKGTRAVRLLKRLEHSNIFETMVFADVLKEFPRT
jgi:hypothetical protein